MLFEICKSDYVCGQTGYGGLKETNAPVELLNKVINLVISNQNKDDINLRTVNDEIEEILKIKRYYVNKADVKYKFID